MHIRSKTHQLWYQISTERGVTTLMKIVYNSKLNERYVLIVGRRVLERY